jgi:hypothetical protein
LSYAKILCLCPLFDRAKTNPILVNLIRLPNTIKLALL